MTRRDTRIDAGTSSSLPSQDRKDKAETVGPAQRISKSKSTNDSMPGDSPVRQGKKRKAVDGLEPTGEPLTCQGRQDYGRGTLESFCVLQPHYIAKIVEDARLRSFGDVILAPIVP